MGAHPADICSASRLIAEITRQGGLSARGLDFVLVDILPEGQAVLFWRPEEEEARRDEAEQPCGQEQLEPGVKVFGKCMMRRGAFQVVFTRGRVIPAVNVVADK